MIADIERLLRLSAESLLGCSQASSLDLSFIAEMMREKAKILGVPENEGNSSYVRHIERRQNAPKAVIGRKRAQTWLDIFNRNR